MTAHLGLVFGLSFWAQVATGSDEPGRVSGIVLDAAGRGIQQAGVSLDGGESILTDAEGMFRASLAPGPHHLEVRALVGTATAAFGISAGLETEIVIMFRPGSVFIDVDAPETSLEPVTAAKSSTRTRSLEGLVVSREAGAPVADARIFVRGGAASARTDREGRFTVVVPEGEVDLVVIHSSYSSRTLRVLGDGGSVRVELEPQVVSLGEMVVTIPKPDYGGLAQQLSDRKESAAVTDGVGLEEMRKTADSTASTATRRIVGASVVGGAYLNVRGLGGRYTNVRLNGVTLPSTDPDLPGFQIDLFPVSLLTGLIVSKTFTPDIPGDFAGGSMNVITRDYPERFSLSLNLSLSARHDTLFRDTLSYDGGTFDFLGFDDGTRSLPDSVPADQKLAAGRTGRPRDAVNEIARSFRPTWSLDASPALPDLSAAASMGDSKAVGDEGRIGYLVTLAYRSTTQNNVDLVTNVKTEGEGDERRVVPREQLDRETGTRQGQLGLLGTLSYRLNPYDQLRWATLFTSTSDDEAARTTGNSEEEGTAIDRTQMTFVERRLLFNQLLGRHEDLFGELDVEWQVNGSVVARNQPDTRNLLYILGPEGFVYRNVTGSGERLYTELDQLDLGAGFDLTHPIFDEGKLKGGFLGRVSSRAFQARRFGTRFVGENFDLRLLAPNELFAPESYGPILEMEEVTRPDDGYDALELLAAWYAMLDTPLVGALRLVGGARLELFRQSIESKAPFPVNEIKSGERTDFDVLPSAGLVYGLTDTMALRASYGGTVARPLVRELAPFLNQDFIRRRNIQGNPEVGRTYVHNFDLRWELFPSDTEVLAVSGFYKRFEAPIESVVLDFRGNITYANIERAENFGAELEARVNLGRLAEALHEFSFLANLALIHSRVSLSPEDQRLATSAERPLAGQSPFVANLSLAYAPDGTGLSFNVFYNVFGRRIQDVGRLGLPDVYEEPFHSLDATMFWQFAEGWTASLYGRNLLNQAQRVDQGGFPFLRSEQGVTVGARLAWEM